MIMNGSHAKLRELKTRNEFKKQPVGDTGLIDEEGMIKFKIETAINEELETA